MAVKTLVTVGINNAVGSKLANVYICDNEGDRPQNPENDSVAIVKGEKWKLFVASGGQWERVIFDTKI